MKIIVGSASQRKIDTVKKVFEQVFKDSDFDIVGCVVKSGVPETPYDKETFDGARNRAMEAKRNGGEANFYVGLESGLVERYGHIYEEAWSCVLAKNGKEYFGYSSGLKVPDYILKKMEELKLEHCMAMEIIEKEFGNLPNDTWGTYSGGLIIREISLEESLRNAIIQALSHEKSFYNK